MDLFSRYVFRQAAGSFLLVLLTLTAIVWIATALGQLKLLTSQGQSFGIFLTMTSLALPGLVALIAPNALLVATLHTLDRLNGDSELIVASASGATVWRLAKPYIALACLVMALVLVINLYLTPASLRTLRSYIVQVRTDLISQVLQPGRFSSPERGLTFHIRERTLDGELMGLVIHDRRERTQIMTYLAERARLEKTSEGTFLVMHDGHVHRRDGNAEDKSVKIIGYDRYIFDISQFGPDTGAAVLKPRERYLSELVNVDETDPMFARVPGQFRSEFHNRFALSVYPLSYVMICLLFLGLPRTARENRWSAVGLAFGLAVGVRLLGLTGTNLTTISPNGLFLVYGAPIGTIVIAAALIQARMSPDARQRLAFVTTGRRKLEDAVYKLLPASSAQSQGGRAG